MILVSKVWKQGKATLVISIGKGIREYYTIEEGDVLEIEMENVKIYKANDKNIPLEEEEEDEHYD